MRDAQIATVVENALVHFHGTRYSIHEWVVMPNHVHVVITPLNDWTLSAILHSWKSFTSKQSNRILGCSGIFWHEDYFDRYIRDERHWNNVVEYVRQNPVTAGLCRSPEEWRYSSAWRGRSHAPL